MRTYGRDSNGKWTLVETDANGSDDPVWLTTLANTLKLAPQESPRFGNYGIPGHASVIQQILPTYYINQVQKQFAKHFSSLQIALTQNDPPVYNVNVITKSGSALVYEVYI